MSAQNVALVRELYRRLEAEDAFPPELLDPDVEYVNPPDAIERGTRRGRAEFAAAIGAVGQAFEETHVEVEDVIDAGDDVVILLTFVVTGRGSGLEQRQPQGHVWTVRDGRGLRFRWFNDPEAALEAAGLR